VSALAIAAIVFVSVFAGAVLGMILQTLLPEHHLSAKSEDVVKLGMGLIATMAAHSLVDPALSDNCHAIATQATKSPGYTAKRKWTMSPSCTT
jgi:hypothetical protein